MEVELNWWISNSGCCRNCVLYCYTHITFSVYAVDAYMCNILQCFPSISIFSNSKKGHILFNRTTRLLACMLVGLFTSLCPTAGLSLVNSPTRTCAICFSSILSAMSLQQTSHHVPIYFRSLRVVAAVYYFLDVKLL